MKEGNIRDAINEFNNMLDGLEQSYIDFGERTVYTILYESTFWKSFKNIFKINNKKLLIDLNILIQITIKYINYI